MRTTQNPQAPALAPVPAGAATLAPDASPNSRVNQRSPASPFSFVPSREGDRLSDRLQPVYGSSGRTPPLRPNAREPSPPLEQLPPPMQDLPEGKASSTSSALVSVIHDSTFKILCVHMKRDSICSQTQQRSRNSGLERHQSAPIVTASPRTFASIRRRNSTRNGMYPSAAHPITLNTNLSVNYLSCKQVAPVREISR